MLVLVDSPLEKAWQAYQKDTGSRVFQYGSVSLFLAVYAVLILFARTPQVMAYNGVDIWFWLVDQIPLGGTVIASLLLISYLAIPAWQDWKGIKTAKEIKEDKEKAKKDKKFKPKEKKPFSVNGYYALFMWLEGLLYGSVIYALLPEVLRWFFEALGDNPALPVQYDAIRSLWSYNSNMAQDVALAFGAGVYEEILFRSLLFMLIIYVAKTYGKKYRYLKQFDLKEDQLRPFPLRIPKYDKKSPGYRWLIILGCVIYASSHFILPYADQLSQFGFIYRLFFGLLMYLIFVKRNPAVAMWTHIVYDLLYFGLRWI